MMLHDFQKGFREDNWRTALSLCMSFIIITAAIACWLDRGGIWSFPLKLMYRDKHDDSIHINYLISAIRNSDPGTFNVVVLSASCAREAILISHEFEEKYCLQSGKKIKFYNLSMSGENFSESLQILEAIGPFKGAVLLGISACRLFSNQDIDKSLANKKRIPYFTPRTNELLINNPHFDKDELIAHNLIRMRPYLKTFLGNMNQLFNGKIEYEQYIYPLIKKQKWKDEDYYRDKNIKLNFSGLEKYDKTGKENIRFIHAISRLGNDYSIPMAFFEQTTHESFSKIAKNLKIDIDMLYRHELKKLILKTGREYIDSQKLANLNSQDYFNYFHVLNKKEEYSQTLIDWIQRIQK